MTTSHSDGHPLSLFKDKKGPMSVGFQNKLSVKQHQTVDKAGESNIDELIEEEFKIATENPADDT
jgi:hypothetical protein